MNSIDEITRWHPLSLQKWLREIDEEDLIIVLPYLPEGTRHLIMENLSSRLRKMAVDYIKNASKIPSRIIDRAKERILEAANDLIDIGELSEPGEEEGNIEPPRVETYLPPVLTSNNTKELIETLIILNSYSKERGIIALEEALHKIKDPFLKEAVQLIIDGDDTDVTEEILKNRVDALNYYRNLLYSIMVEGVLGIQSGDSSWTLETKLKSYLPPEIDPEK